MCLWKENGAYDERITFSDLTYLYRILNSEHSNEMSLSHLLRKLG